MNIIILTDADFISENLCTIQDSRADHIIDILRSNEGDTVLVGLLNSKTGKATITKIEDRAVTLNCFDWKKEKSESTIDLICALPRPQTVKKVLITSAMMGVRNLYFIRSNRVEKSYFHSPLLSDENMKLYLLEGLSQGGNIFLPTVSIHHKFRQFIENEFIEIEKTHSDDAFYLFPEPGSSKSLSQVMRKTYSRFVVAVGPEGGWVDFEIEKFESVGFKKFNLSQYILRVEHAVTAILAQIELLQSK